MNSTAPFSDTFIANGFGQLLNAEFSGEITLPVDGCTDTTACNFDSAATNDGSCTYADAGLDCDGNCLADTDGDGVCDEFETAGCTDATACNYDSSATDDDGMVQVVVVTLRLQMLVMIVMATVANRY